MPIGADLVLHEEPDPEQARNDGAALGRVIEKTARRWATPLAIPLMDLRLEKADLLACAGVAAYDAEKFHFTSRLDEPTLALSAPANPRRAALAASPAIRRSPTSPRSPILFPSAWPSALSRSPRVSWPTPSPPRRCPAPAPSLKTPTRSALLWQCLQLAEAAVQRSVRSQIAHGARAIMICEPAACTAFLSPRQLRAGSNAFRAPRHGTESPPQGRSRRSRMRSHLSRLRRAHPPHGRCLRTSPSSRHPLARRLAQALGRCAPRPQRRRPLRQPSHQVVLL